MLFLLVSLSILNGVVTVPEFFDRDLLKSYINSTECLRQLDYLWNNPLGTKFLDACGKIPSGIYSGNTQSLGEYRQCIDIAAEVIDMRLNGKYCRLSLSIKEPFTLGKLSTVFQDSWLNATQAKRVESRKNMVRWMEILRGRNEKFSKIASDIAADMFGPVFSLGICVPRVCEAGQAIDYVQEKLGILELNYAENICRIPGDIVFSTADRIAIILFTLLLSLTVASSYYDFMCPAHTYINDNPKKRELLTSFSVFSNFNSVLGPQKSRGLASVEGLRAVSMLWIILGHNYTLSLNTPLLNTNYAYHWITRWPAVFVSSSHIAVDTFFLLSGIFCVYSTLPRYTRQNLLRGLPVFYLGRLVRIWPVLIAVLVAQTSILPRGASGQMGLMAAGEAILCREHWLAVLTHVQNFLDPTQICLLHTWYVSVDTQLYFLSPLILISLFGTKYKAIYALARVILVTLALVTFISFSINSMSSYYQFRRGREEITYLWYYYQNTAARSPPFFIGMAYGYFFHLNRDKKINFSKITVCAMWTLSSIVVFFCFAQAVMVAQWEHDNQMVDNLINSFMRSLWAAVIGWVLLACENNYGGPVEWVLSHSIWRLPARISYAMYLCHFPLIQLVMFARSSPHYFTTLDMIYRYVADVGIAFLVALLLTVLVEEPILKVYRLIFYTRELRSEEKRSSSSTANLIKAEHQI